MSMALVRPLIRGWKYLYHDIWEFGILYPMRDFYHWQSRMVGMKDRRNVTLREYGLRRHDIDMPQEAINIEMREALRRLPPEVVDARNQRLKRAMDLCMKKTTLPKDMQALQTPDEDYLMDMFLQVHYEWRERIKHGSEPPK